MDKVTVEFVNQDKWGKHDTWATLQGVVSKAFPEEVITRQSSKIGGVQFDYVNTGGDYSQRFGGVILRITDGHFRSTIRVVKLDRDKQIDLDKIRVKHQELRDMAVHMQQAAQEQHDKDKVRSNLILEVGEQCKIVSPDHLGWTSGVSEVFTLTLRDLTRGQVESIMYLLHEAGIRKEKQNDQGS